jgi:hypothetical protein
MLNHFVLEQVEQSMLILLTKSQHPVKSFEYDHSILNKTIFHILSIFKCLHLNKEVLL